MNRIFRNRKFKSGSSWCFLRWTDVDPVGDGDIYLTRFHLFQTPLCSVMIHWINLPDPQPDLHDHPNDFISLVVRGGYVEEIPDPKDVGAILIRRIRYINFVQAKNRHRILDVKKPTVTLVLANRVKRNWGFWVDGEFVPWREYTKLSAKGS